jgi:hypothetical protein
MFNITVQSAVFFGSTILLLLKLLTASKRESNEELYPCIQWVQPHVVLMQLIEGRRTGNTHTHTHTLGHTGLKTVCSRY